MPFYLRTGKALGRDPADRHPDVPHPADRAGSATASYGPNQLMLELSDSPEFGVSLMAKRPGPDMDLVPLTFHLDIADEDPDDDAPLEAYERLLLDVMRGDQTLFTRADEVDRLWQVCQPVLDDPPPRRGRTLAGRGGPTRRSPCRAAPGWRLRRCLSDVACAIADHGLIGDLRTCALVGHRRHHRLVLRAALRLAERVRGDPRHREAAAAGSLAPTCEVSRTQQFYFPDTAVLITRFLTADGVAEVHDFMPVLGVGDPEHRQRAGPPGQRRARQDPAADAPRRQTGLRHGSAAAPRQSATAC